MVMSGLMVVIIALIKLFNKAVGALVMRFMMDQIVVDYVVKIDMDATTYRIIWWNFYGRLTLTNQI